MLLSSDSSFNWPTLQKEPATACTYCSEYVLQQLKPEWAKATEEAGRKAEHLWPLPVAILMEEA